MAYFTRGGIFSGVDDSRGVYDLRGLDDVDPVLRRSLRGLDDVDPVLRRSLRGLGATPPGTSEKAKKDVRKTYYYLYSLAAMDPVFRTQGAVAAGVGTAGLVAALATGGLSLILTGGAAAGAAIAISGTENCIMETTLWWQKSKKDRDNYIKEAMVGNDVKDVLRKAARRMDNATKGIRSASGRAKARARAYFQDFIAVGQRAALKSLTPDQQGAFGVAYLDALAKGKNEQAAIAAGTAASDAAQRKAGKMTALLAAKKAKQDAAKRRQEAQAKAQQAAREAQEKRAKVEAAKAKVRSARDAAAAAAAQQEAAAAAQAAAAAEAAAQQAAAAAAQAAAQEQAATNVEKAVEKEVEQVQPTTEEKKEAAAQDSDEEKSEDTVAVAVDVATGTSTTPDATTAVAAKDAAAEAGAKVGTAPSGGGGILPIVAAAGALALGAPALPVVGAAAALAFLMRKK